MPGIGLLYDARNFFLVSATVGGAHLPVECGKGGEIHRAPRDAVATTSLHPVAYQPAPLCGMYLLLAAYMSICDACAQR